MTVIVREMISDRKKQNAEIRICIVAQGEGKTPIPISMALNALTI